MALELPETIYATAFIKSVGGVSLFDRQSEVTPKNFEQFHGKSNLINGAAFRLQRSGFQVLSSNELGIGIAASAKIYKKAFNVNIITIKLNISSNNLKIGLTCEDNDEFGFIDSSQSDFADVLDGLVISQSVGYFNLISADPPKTVKPQELLPSDIAQYLLPSEIPKQLNSIKAHKNCIKGERKNKEKVKIVIIDTGCYKHPYFKKNNFTPHIYKYDKKTKKWKYSKSLKDHDGHGTAMVANALAVAPKAEVIVATRGKKHLQVLNTFHEVIASNVLQPDIVSCSWGLELDEADPSLGIYQSRNRLRALSLYLANASKKNIIVLFASGDNKSPTVEAHLENVITVGGAYFDKGGKIKVSDIASSGNYSSSSNVKKLKLLDVSIREVKLGLRMYPSKKKKEKEIIERVISGLNTLKKKTKGNIEK